MRYDAIVVGAGIIGASCAEALSRGGRRVLVVDAGAAAGGTSAHCEGNLLVSDKGPGPELELARRGLELWPAFAERAAAELGPGFPDLEFEPKGGLVVATTTAGLSALEDFAATQREVGVVAEPRTPEQCRELEPDLAPGILGGVAYPEDAQSHPVLATEALLALARRQGAQVMEHARVVGPLVEGGRLVGVRVAGQGAPGGAAELRAELVVNAAGPWAGEVAGLLGAPLPAAPRRGVVLVTSRMPQRVFRKVYDADYVGAVGSGEAALMTSTVVESTRGGTVLIGSSREQVGFDDRMRPEVLAAIAAKAVMLFPFLAGATLLRSYSGFRPFMPDHLPVIGPDARVPGLWHCTGHEGAGVGLSLPGAELLAALADGRPTPASPAGPLDAAAFAVDRPSLVERLEAAERRAAESRAGAMPGTAPKGAER